MTGQTSGAVRDLQRAIREIRIAQAERSDVIVDMHEAERTRLALLSEALEGLRRDVPEAANEAFELAVLPGNPPRLWVDATSFVLMARDKRTYRFLKDTRLGRTVLLESTEIEPVADAVTGYVAERIVERDRALAADWPAGRAEPRATEERQEALPAPQRRGRGGARTFFGFLFGLVAGAALAFAVAWDQGWLLTENVLRAVSTIWPPAL